MFFKIFTVLLIIAVTRNNGSPQPPSKIDPALLQVFRNSSKANIFIEMREGNGDILCHIDSLRFSSRTEKINTLKSQLELLAKTSQKGIRSILEENRAEFISFWVNNQVYVREASLELVEKLEKDPEVSLIREEKTSQVPVREGIYSNNIMNGSWGIDKIEAAQAWGLDGGNKGEGVVVAVLDSGVRVTHEALRSNFRADYGWFDPITADAEPNDRVGHGTHVTGTVVGLNGIGVAPGAQWIACRVWNTPALRQENGAVACGQWIVCPTLPNGTNPDCSKAPKISQNSWGLEDMPSYGEVINAWHSAGIIPIFAIGNSGPNCGTTLPPGNYENVISVGSTDVADMAAESSSRGPTSEGNVKPEIAAPGVNITSAYFAADDAYAGGFGTSMACPHVSGAVALLLSRNSSLSYEDVKSILQNNTDRDLGETETCGGTPPNQFPNNIYGYGRLNARKSLEAILAA